MKTKLKLKKVTLKNLEEPLTQVAGGDTYPFCSGGSACGSECFGESFCAGCGGGSQNFTYCPPCGGC